MTIVFPGIFRPLAKQHRTNLYRAQQGGKKAMSWMIRRDPINELRNLQEDFNRVFSGALPRFFSNEESLSGNWTPSVDIYEDQNGIVLEADLPGVKPGDFNLSIENYKLTLTGERKFEKETKNDNWHRVERSYGTFTRTFALPSTVNVEEVKADFKDGVLRVTLPKREEVKARQIQVAVKTDANGAQAKAADAK
ncbi:MAG: Hsp20/alpha crystallin family protein [Acidobacteria bacterium]|nr:Hsp20/alpha crystallin family protein [Acidobacteriota bacterium]